MNKFVCGEKEELDRDKTEDQRSTVFVCLCLEPNQTKKQLKLVKQELSIHK